MLNVHLRITDAATGLPTPVRVRVVGPDGLAHFPPLGRAAEFPGGRNEDVGGHLRLGRERWWYIDGACEIPLPAGVPLRVQAAKGPEFIPLDETVTLGAGQIALRFALSRWTDSHCDGWVSVDTRCHFLTPHAALLEAQAEGVDVVNLLAMPFPVLALDANTYTTTPNLLAFSGQDVALERAGCSVVVNTLNTHPVLGKVALLNSHRPVFPLTFGGEETDDWGICDWCDQCHRKKGLTVWVGAFEPAAGVIGGESLVAAILGKIDAIEVTADPRKVPLLPWVYRLWDTGFLVPLVGASGKDSNREALGSVRTYAHGEGEDPTPRPPPQFVRGNPRFPLQPPPGEGEKDRPTPPTPLPEGKGEKEPSSPASSDDAQEATRSVTPSPFGGGGRGEGSSASPWLDAVRAGRTFVTAGPLLALTRDGNRVRAEARARGNPPPVEIVTNGQVVASGPGAAEAVVTGSGWVAVRCPAQSGFAHTSPVAAGEPARKPEARAALRALVEQTREWVETHGRFGHPKRRQALLDRCAEVAQKLEGRA